MNYEKAETGPACLDRVEAAHRQAEAEAAMQAEFLRAAMARDVNELCPWAPMVHQYKDGVTTKRLQTVGEVMALSMDFSKGPQLDELMGLLCNVAYSADMANQPAKARDILSRMALVFSEYHAEAA